jgi:hypothetical protein
MKSWKSFLSVLGLSLVSMGLFSIAIAQTTSGRSASPLPAVKTPKPVDRVELKAKPTGGALTVAASISTGDTVETGTWTPLVMSQCS